MGQCKCWRGNCIIYRFCGTVDFVKIDVVIKAIVGNIVSPDPTVRKLTFANFINTFGNGAFHTVGIIYFSFVVGLGAQKVALAFTIGAAVSLAISVPGRAFSG
jgi:hypothetical protein